MEETEVLNILPFLFSFFLKFGCKCHAEGFHPIRSRLWNKARRLFHLSTTGKVRKSIDYSQMAILDSFFQIPSFKHSMKWPWLSLAYFLLRFLLVGQTLPTLLDEDLTKDGIEALSSRPFRNVSRQTSRQMSLCGTPEKSSYRQLSVSDRSSIRVEEIIPAARVAIQVSDLVCSRSPKGLLYRRHHWWGGPMQI